MFPVSIGVYAAFPCRRSSRSGSEVLDLEELPEVAVKSWTWKKFFLTEVQTSQRLLIFPHFSRKTIKGGGGGGGGGHVTTKSGKRCVSSLELPNFYMVHS